MSVIEELRTAITAYLDSPEAEKPENRAMTRTATDLSRSLPDSPDGEKPTPGQEAGAAAADKQKQVSEAAKAGPAPRDEETKPKTMAEAHQAAHARMTANKEPVTP
jgi:hypothetical protein